MARAVVRLRHRISDATQYWPTDQYLAGYGLADRARGAVAQGRSGLSRVLPSNPLPRPPFDLLGPVTLSGLARFTEHRVRSLRIRGFRSQVRFDRDKSARHAGS